MASPRLWLPPVPGPVLYSCILKSFRSAARRPCTCSLSHSELQAYSVVSIRLVSFWMEPFLFLWALRGTRRHSGSASWRRYSGPPENSRSSLKHEKYVCKQTMHQREREKGISQCVPCSVLQIRSYLIVLFSSLSYISTYSATDGPTCLS